MKKRTLLSAVGILLFGILIGGCSQSGKDSSSTDTSASIAEESDAASNTEEILDENEDSKGSEDTGEKVTITHLTWRVPDVGDAFDVFLEKFHAEHPSITVEVQNVSSDQYYNMLQTRLLSNDPPDIITTEPEAAKYISQAENGYLLDITDEPFMENLISGTLSSVTLDEKIYGIPYDTSSLVIFYNKQIFAEHNISVPTNYTEFLEVCETLKAAGVTPISYGIKDEYVTAFMPYQIAPTAVYSKTPDWDTQLEAGTTSFLSDEWRRVFQVPFELKEKGYMTDNALGIGDQQSVEIFAKGEAAMTATGTWATATIRDANPDIDLGLFPFPANTENEDNAIVLSTGQVMAISSTTKYIDACKEYLAAWTDVAYAQDWTNSAKSISTVVGVSNDFDETINDLTPYLENSDTWGFASTGWPAGVQDAFRPIFQEVWSGKGTVDDILTVMDEAAQKSLSNK